MVRARLASFALAGSLLAVSGCFHLSERGGLHRHATCGTTITGRSHSGRSVTDRSLVGRSPAIVATPYVQRGGDACCCADGSGAISVAEGPFVPPPPDTSVFTSEPPALSSQGPQIIDVPRQSGSAPWTPPQPRLMPVPQNATPTPYTP